MSDFAKFFATFLTNGVFPNPSTNLQVTAVGTDMRVYIPAGSAFINGLFYINDSDLYFTLSTADGSANRIDRIVVQYDVANRKINIAVKKGTVATSPAATALEQDSDYYELALADVYVGTGVTEITQSNITDQRSNTTVCGWVNSLIQVNTTTLFNQYQTWLSEQETAYSAKMDTDFTAFKSAFVTWFTAIKGQLSTDAAGNLQTEIDTNATYETASGTATAITLASVTLRNGYSLTFIASADNSGAATTINGLPLYKPNTTTAPTLVSGKAYTVWYNSAGSCFFLKAGATGTATVNQVPAGLTFSNENDTDLTGTAFGVSWDTFIINNAGEKTEEKTATVYGTTVPDCAFYNHALVSVNLPNEITYIGYQAFYKCASLVLAALPTSLTNIAAQAFYCCFALTAITLPSGLTTIGWGAFQYCTALTKIWIPATCTTISVSNYSESPFYVDSSSLKIYCEASSKPSGWSTYWNYYGSSGVLTVTWGETLAEFESL
jgi:hypothetical protein